MITVFQDVFSSKPFYTSVPEALDRIRTGKSKPTIELVRAEIDTERRNTIKKTLPCFLFSGRFTTRNDNSLQEHSGYVILDLDQVEPTETKAELADKPWIYAAWTSPSGEGVKALVKIKDPTLHRQHLKAIFKEIPKADPVNINTARVCFESWDPEIYVNETATVYETAIDKVDGFDQTQLLLGDQKVAPSAGDIFKKIQKWLINSGNAFRTGERNIFIYKLAGACSRFGIDQYDCIALVSSEYLTHDSDFTRKESEAAISSAYKSPGNKFGTAKFEKDQPVNVSNKSRISTEELGEGAKPKDVVYGLDAYNDAIELYDHGYKSARTTHIPQLDERFKLKRGELTVLSGIGNYGKTNFLEQVLLIQSLLDGDKWAFFSPESFPAHEFYHNLTETYLGADCTPKNPGRPDKESYIAAYRKISEHFFFVYPDKNSPTPEYIRERFLELVIKEKVSGCIIDPFNKLSNQWSDRDDKYLEKFLSETIQWARDTNVYFFIICHPKQLKKDGNKNYPCPEVFDLANGAMWNNMADNILIYHRPNYQENPADPTCELHSKKIRRQKIVGFPGVVEFMYNRANRRYYFDGFSPLDKDSKFIAPPKRIVSEKKKKENVSPEGESLELPF